MAKSKKKITKTEKLRNAFGSGNLRYWLEGKLDDETLQYLLDVVARAVKA